MILYLLFFLSGAAALIYEVLWLKELGLLFGNTAYAAATTLAVFFLGLASGSWALGRRAAGLTRPLRTYALLEWGIAATAVLYFGLTPLFRWIYGGVYPVLGQSLAAMTLIKLVLALGVLFPPAFLMGGTLPVMAQHLIRRRTDLGRTGTLLYLVNTVGAATGALLAGFILPIALGFRGSYAVAIALNGFVGLAAWVIGGAPRAAAEASAAEEDAETTPPPDRLAGNPRAIQALAFLSGFLVLGLEVVWTRMFAQVLNNSVYSFTAILVTFLVALALGSGVANVLSRRGMLLPGRALVALSVLSWLLVAASGIVFFQWTNGLADVLPGGGWSGYVARIVGLAVAVMLLPGVVIGTIYPYLLKVSEATSRAPGHTIGNLGAINSVGGILGSLITGFVLLATVGLWTSVNILAAGYLAVGGIALAGTLSRRGVLTAVASAGVGALVVILVTPELPTVRVDAEQGQTLIHTWEGSHGTVAVVETEGDRYIKLDNNYSLGGSGAVDVERGQARLPLYLVPPPESVFFLGMGTGISAGGALDFPVKRVVTAELVPEVVTAARLFFHEWTNGLFSDERSRVVVEDGRHYLQGTRERFDLIISDLFVPWHAGTGSLYSREHFKACRERLNEGGSFVLWVPARQLSRAEFDILARTLLEVFPQVTMWRGEFLPVWPTLGLICSMDEWQVDPKQVRRNLAHVIVDRAPGRVTDSDVLPWLNYAGNVGAARRLWAGARINTDDRPIIEYMAPKTQQRALSDETAWLAADELVALIDEIFEAVPPEEDPFLAASGDEQISYVRAGQMLYTVGVHLDAGRTDEAAALYREVLAVAPLDIFPGLANR